jgi:hypothetical protein
MDDTARAMRLQTVRVGQELVERCHQSTAQAQHRRPRRILRGWIGWRTCFRELPAGSRPATAAGDAQALGQSAGRFGLGHGGRLARRASLYLAGSVAGVAGAGGEWHSPRLSPRGRSRITEHGGDGRGFHPAMVRTCARAFALSVMPGNRRRSSMAADSSPSWLKMARIASASASVMRNIPKAW